MGRKYVERRGGLVSAPEMFRETKGIVIGDGARTTRKRKLDSTPTSTSMSSSPKTTPDIKSFLCRKAAAKRERAREEEEEDGDEEVRINALRVGMLENVELLT